MSAPDTNTKKQERQHKTPLVGMAWVVGFAIVLLVALTFWLGYFGNEPGDGDPDVEQSSQAGGGGSVPADATTGEAGTSGTSDGGGQTGN